MLGITCEEPARAPMVREVCVQMFNDHVHLLLAATGCLSLPMPPPRPARHPATPPATLSHRSPLLVDTQGSNPRCGMNTGQTREDYIQCHLRKSRTK